MDVGVEEEAVGCVVHGQGGEDVLAAVILEGGVCETLDLYVSGSEI